MSRLAFLLFSSGLCSLLAAQGAAPADAPASQPATTQPTTTAPAPQPYNILTTPRLTGDWGGMRTTLEENGIGFGLFLTSVYQRNTHGGLKTHHAHEITGSADYDLSLDLEKLKLIHGGTLYARAESSWGDGISETSIGDVFGVNGDAVGNQEIALFECWYEQLFFGDKLRVRVGKLDLTVDFDTNAYANDETTQFLNNALILTGNVPWPDYGLGAEVFAQPTEWLYFGVAAADAQANGVETGFNTTFHDEDYFFGVFEFGLTPEWQTSRGKLPGAYRFGLWYDPQPKEKFFNVPDGQYVTIPTKRDDIGFYVNLNQLVFKEKPDDDADTQGLGVFFRYGHAADSVNLIEHFWSVGGQYQGPIPTRDNDVLGFGFAQGILSETFRSLNGGDRESVYEVYYNAQVLPWLSISPDIQFIRNPGETSGHDAFVFGVRVQASF